MTKVSNFPFESRIKSIDKRLLRQEWKEGIYRLIHVETGEVLTASTKPLDRYLKDESQEK
jgi:hypothetical protein